MQVFVALFVVLLGWTMAAIIGLPVWVLVAGEIVLWALVIRAGFFIATFENRDTTGHEGDSLTRKQRDGI